MRYWISTLFVVATTNAAAQSPEQLAQRVITEEGITCPSVTSMRAMGMIGDTGDAAIAVACSDGGRHAVRLHVNDTLSYISSCSMLEATSGAECFAR